MNEGAITVLIPAYRSDQRLVRALSSLAEQTCPAAVVEVSFDGAPGYEPPPLPAVPGLRVRHQPRQWGWPAHINRMLDLVSTPYFMILLHDDTITPGYLHAARSALESNASAAFAHGSLRNHGLRTNFVTTGSIVGTPVERVREFVRRGPTAAELGFRAVSRSSAIRDGLHLRFRRSDGMFANTLFSLELLFWGESVLLDGEYYDKYIDPDGLSRAFHGRPRSERSRMLGESVANLATLLSEHGVADSERDELLSTWTAWLLGIQQNWNVLADEPSSDARMVVEVRQAIAGFVADVASSLVTPSRR